MDNELIEIGIWIKIFFFCVFGLGAAIGFFIFFSGNAFFTKASGGDASIMFSPATIVAKKGDVFTVQLMVDTNKSYVRGIDVVASFDPSALTLRMITPTAQKDTELKTYLPLDSSNTFDFLNVISHANKTGTLDFGAIAADVQTNKMKSAVNGNFVMATLEFFVLKEGNATVTLLKTHPTRDSTVVQDVNPPVNILSKVNTLYITPQTTIPTQNK